MHRRNYVAAFIVLFGGAFCVPLLHAEHRKIAPTFLYRDVSAAQPKQSDITTPMCHYRPLFGQGDSDSSVVVGVARYGEAIIDPNGACATVRYPEEDQVYVVLKGSGSAKYGDQDVPLKTEDYLYIPSSVSHTISNKSSVPMSVIVMGFHTKGFEKAQPPSRPLKGNIEDVPTTVVNGHPDSTRYRLLMANDGRRRDPSVFGAGTIPAGRVLISLFLMEIAPGGTNFPHHHERAEEIYLVLSGHGVMVAGGGMDGIAGRHPSKAGDAYFFRLNATVGYYSAPNTKSRILAVRSWYPGMQQKFVEH